MPAFYGRGLAFDPPHNTGSLFGLADDTSDDSGFLDSGIDGVLVDSPTGADDPNDLGTDVSDPLWADVITKMTALAPQLTIAMQSMNAAAGPAQTAGKTAQWNSVNDQLISSVAQFNIAADALNALSSVSGFPQIPEPGLSGGLPSIIGGLSVGGFLLIISACVAAISACSSLVSSVLGKSNPVSQALANAVGAVNAGVSKALIYGMVGVGLFMLLGKEI